MGTLPLKKSQSRAGDQTINQVFGQLPVYNIPDKNLKTSDYNGDIRYSVHDANKEYELRGNQVKQSPNEFLQNKQAIKIENPNSFIPRNSNLLPKNQNTGIVNDDFPGMFGLPVPSPANLSNLGTGNGKGGEIINRSQIKNASEFGMGRDAFGQELTPRKVNWNYETYKSLEKPAKFFSGLGPLAYTYRKSAEGPWKGAMYGAGALGLAGLLGAFLHNRLANNPMTYDSHGRLVEDTSANTKRYLKYGLGAALAGALLGHAFGTERLNFGDATKTASIKKHAFFPHHQFGGIGPMMDPNVILLNLTNKINSDNNISFAQKNELINQIRTLPTSSLAEFYPLMGMASGAGIGYIVAKKLLSLGKTGSILASILGGTMGLGIGLNGLQNSIPTFDPFRTPFNGIPL